MKQHHFIQGRAGKVLGCLIVLGISLAAVGQTSCDSLDRHLAFLQTIYDQNRSETKPERKKKLYQQYINESKKGAAIATRCFASQAVAAGSVGYLKNNYLVGKLYLQAYACDDARKSFDLCLGNPHCGTERIGAAGTYAQVIGRYNCNRPQVEGSANSNGYSLDYDGKGNAFVKNVFAQVAEGTYNETPLLPDEIEKIMARTVWAADTIDVARVRQLSGQDKYLLAPPFLLMQTGSAFASVPIKWEKNLALNTQTGAPAPMLADYNAFMQKHYQAIQQTYFDKYNATDKLIPVYLAGGDYSQTGVKDFLSFCNQIHYRAWKKVAYYMPLDNSIVAWASSGGGTLVHELVHALMAGDFPQAPWWLNEGMASLHEEANEQGMPVNNYRLILIQQAIARDQYCIDWRDLIRTAKYEGADQTTYNLLHGYSRYFCKFLHDKSGKDGLAAIYRQIRDGAALTDTGQIAIIGQVAHLTADQLQQQWQAWLLTERVTQRWEPTIRGMVSEFPKTYQYPFKKATAAYPDQSLQALQEYYKSKMKERTVRSGSSHGVGPQQF
ncbi:hypothetical protein [Paraflavitalea pollutisoli]|uniref:hypothetical protein n=1 Tax=Paraflavitalea pollutisoli TaxID=3034143 RepID=UPI0023EDA426|nr:hypothetical protein [Paraflavitalea sp. H1-2-19X]